MVDFIDKYLEFSPALSSGLPTTFPFTTGALPLRTTISTSVIAGSSTSRTVSTVTGSSSNGSTLTSLTTTSRSSSSTISTSSTSRRSSSSISTSSSHSSSATIVTSTSTTTTTSTNTTWTTSTFTLMPTPPIVCPKVRLPVGMRELNPGPIIIEPFGSTRGPVLVTLTTGQTILDFVETQVVTFKPAVQVVIEQVDFSSSTRTVTPNLVSSPSTNADSHRLSPALVRLALNLILIIF